MLVFVLMAPWLILAVLAGSRSGRGGGGKGRQAISPMQGLRRCFVKTSKELPVDVHGAAYTGDAFIRRSPTEPMLAVEFSAFPFNRYLVLEVLRDGRAYARVMSSLDSTFVRTSYSELKELAAVAAKELDLPAGSDFAACTRYEPDYGGGGW